MKKKKLTNRELNESIEGLSNNDQMLLKEIFETKQIVSLYLEYKGDTDNFNKFVKGKVEEFEQQQIRDLYIREQISFYTIIPIKMLNLNTKL